MFTYVGLFRMTPVAREHLEKTPEYLDKIRVIVEHEGGKLSASWPSWAPGSTWVSSRTRTTRRRSASSEDREA